MGSGLTARPERSKTDTRGFSMLGIDFEVIKIHDPWYTGKPDAGTWYAVKALTKKARKQFGCGKRNTTLVLGRVGERPGLMNDKEAEEKAKETFKQGVVRPRRY